MLRPDVHADHLELDPDVVASRTSRTRRDRVRPLPTSERRSRSSNARCRRGRERLGARSPRLVPVSGPSDDVRISVCDRQHRRGSVLKQPTLLVGGVPVFWFPYLWLRPPDRVGLLPLDRRVARERRPAPRIRPSMCRSTTASARRRRRGLCRRWRGGGRAVDDAAQRERRSMGLPSRESSLTIDLRGAELPGQIGSRSRGASTLSAVNARFAVQRCSNRLHLA